MNAEKKVILLLSILFIYAFVLTSAIVVIYNNESQEESNLTSPVKICCAEPIEMQTIAKPVQIRSMGSQGEWQ